MEYLEGRDLKKVMEEVSDERGRMTPQQILPLLKQICAGLQVAHDAGIVHRDIKPENIFLLYEEPQQVKILDFGIAKLLATEERLAEQTRTGAILGTPLFMAPEQAAGRNRQISTQTDLYSLGVLLYWMLSGSPPFKDPEAFMLMVKHVTEEAPPLEQAAPILPEMITDLVSRCMSKDPSQRPGSAAELL